MLTVGSPTFTAQAAFWQPGRTHGQAAARRGGRLPQESRATCCRETLRRSGEHAIYTETWITTRSRPGEKTCLSSRPEGSPAAEPGAGEEAQRCRENRGQTRSLRGSAPRHPRASCRGQIHQAGLFKDVLWPLCKNGWARRLEVVAETTETVRGLTMSSTSAKRKSDDISSRE